MKKGLTHIYCGDGKGKTTAATGAAMRAAGNGKKVLFVQFLKSGKSGEVNILEQLEEVTVLRANTTKKFSWDMSDEEKSQAYKNDTELLEQAFEAVQEGHFDFLIFDEALGACEAELLDRERLLAFMREKPEKLELIITGRTNDKTIIEAADYVTEMKKIKHPFDEGVKCRKGVEF